MITLRDPTHGCGLTAVSSTDAPGLPRLWLPAPCWTISKIPGHQRQGKPPKVLLIQRSQSCRAVTACRSAPLTAPSPDAGHSPTDGSGRLRVKRSQYDAGAPPQRLWPRDAASRKEQHQQKSAAELAHSRRQGVEHKTKAAHRGKAAVRRRLPAGQRGASSAVSSTKHSNASPRADPLPGDDISTTLECMLTGFAAASRRAAVINGEACAADDALIQQARKVTHPDDPS